MVSRHRPIPFLLLLLLHSFAAGADLDADRSALLALRSAVGRSLLPTWAPSASPCAYRGVTCSPSGRVSALRLPGVGLLGQVPAGTLANLTALKTLSLRYNALSGPLPSLPRLLRGLHLQHNRFSGALPGSLSSMTSLVRLDLAGNNLSGSIAADLSRLSRLRTLSLESNSFSGPVPDLEFPNLVQFNVSFNDLSGSIPPGLRRMPADAFLGMSVCGGPFPACPLAVLPPAAAGNGGSSSSSSGLKKKKKNLSGGAIAGIAVGCAVGLGVLITLLVLLLRKKPRSKKKDASAAGVPKPAGGAKRLVFFREEGAGRGEFELEDLLRASAEVLGKGPSGTAYRAVLETGLAVAVKRLKDVAVGEREFGEKIGAVGLMDHPNLVPLKAYYYGKDEKLLVYEYMPLGSLSALLHGNLGSGRAPLNWEVRSAIALGAARGLAYIHSTNPTSSHGNIKSSNILLGKSNVDARVSDHGLARLVGAATASSSVPARAAGYLAPEVTDPRRVSQRADVYSFGVLLLELLTGKAPAQALPNEEGVDLPRWVRSVVREEWASRVFDAELTSDQSSEVEMVELLQLAIGCAAQCPDDRPSMPEVAGKIEDICRSGLRGTDTIDVSEP